MPSNLNPKSSEQELVADASKGQALQAGLHEDPLTSQTFPSIIDQISKFLTEQKARLVELGIKADVIKELEAVIEVPSAETACLSSLLLTHQGSDFFIDYKSPLDVLALDSSGKLQAQLKTLGTVYFLKKLFIEDAVLAENFKEVLASRTQIDDGLLDHIYGFYKRCIFNPLNPFVASLDREFRDENSNSETYLLSGILTGLFNDKIDHPGIVEGVLRKYFSSVPSQIQDLDDQPISKPNAVFLVSMAASYNDYQAFLLAEKEKQFNKELAVKNAEVSLEASLAEKLHAERARLEAQVTLVTAQTENVKAQAERDGIRTKLLEQERELSGVRSLELEKQAALAEIEKQNQEVKAKLEASNLEKARLNQQTELARLALEKIKAEIEVAKTRAKELQSFANNSVDAPLRPRPIIPLPRPPVRTSRNKPLPLPPNLSNKLPQRVSVGILDAVVINYGSGFEQIEIQPGLIKLKDVQEVNYKRARAIERQHNDEDLNLRLADEEEHRNAVAAWKKRLDLYHTHGLKLVLDIEVAQMFNRTNGIPSAWFSPASSGRVMLQIPPNQMKFIEAGWGKARFNLPLNHDVLMEGGKFESLCRALLHQIEVMDGEVVLRLPG